MKSKGKNPTAPWDRRTQASKAPPTGPRPGPAGPRQAPSRAALPSELCVIGRHAVLATLNFQPERALELFHIDAADLKPTVERARQLGIPVRQVDLDTIDALAGGREQGTAQGIVLSCGPFPYISVDELDKAPRVTLALDGVEDPRNFGAAARAAYALGAELVVVPSDRAAAATAAAIKASAGALCRIPVAREINFRRALDVLKEKGAWIVGAEADGDRAPWDVDTAGQVVIVVGGEDRGLRRLTREACDFVTAIPMAADDMSLNAADAAGLLLYEVLRQRRTAKRS
jgi:23S rRNA (guanosine2251-2'-O)-methyltransferase